MADEQAKTAEQEKTAPQLSVRDKRQADRLARLAKVKGAPGVRVVPRDDNIRALMTHQPSGIGFPDSGSVEWPNDAFTQRRIADGDVTLEESGEGKSADAAASPTVSPPAAKSSAV